MTARDVRFGVLFSGSFPLQRVLSGSVLADKLGFDSCWYGEDYFYQGGIATATLATISSSTNSTGKRRSSR